MDNEGIDNNQMDTDAFSSQAPARAQVIWALSLLRLRNVWKPKLNQAFYRNCFLFKEL